MNYAERLRRKIEEAKGAPKPEATEEADAAAATTPERKAPTIAELNRQSRTRRIFR